ncbi:MAG: hypothetical protein QG660_1534, partial [Pseudomonadota bacterium]|nr:hypothetical protein [Pseudomonadota bacterium]
LDTQFRMHPALGEFVSKEFYEKEKLTPLKSVRPACEFMEKIPDYENKVCAWLDVPLSHGNEDRPGTSWRRQSEAKRIAPWRSPELTRFCSPDRTHCPGLPRGM